jgi:hypothetical protein
LLLLAVTPSLADVKAHERAEGNRMDVAVAVGQRIFATTWPAQVLHVEANQVGTNLVLGLHVNGVHFHDEMTFDEFKREIQTLVAQSLTVAKDAEEVDIWVTVPIKVGKDVIVSGDLAKPTNRNVYTLTVRRGETPASLAKRLAEGTNVFVDEEWARTAFKKGE